MKKLGIYLLVLIATAGTITGNVTKITVLDKDTLAALAVLEKNLKAGNYLSAKTSMDTLNGILKSKIELSLNGEDTGLNRYSKSTSTASPTNVENAFIQVVLTIEEIQKKTAEIRAASQLSSMEFLKNVSSIFLNLEKLLQQPQKTTEGKIVPAISLADLSSSLRSLLIEAPSATSLFFDSPANKKWGVQSGQTPTSLQKLIELNVYFMSAYQHFIDITQSFNLNVMKMHLNFTFFDKSTSIKPSVVK